MFSLPTFAPQYRDMLARGGRQGVSLEDKSRTGVWVPLAWLQTGTKAKSSSWKPFTAEELQNIYGRSQPTPEREAEAMSNIPPPELTQNLPQHPAPSSARTPAAQLIYVFCSNRFRI